MGADTAPHGHDERADLAAMVASLSRVLIAAERPVLLEHELTMWGYAVLTALSTGPMPTQGALARAIGADKTRIIGVLDGLQERGLIRRQPDPADRRMHLLSLTAEGRQLYLSARAGIRSHEERLLARLPDAERDAFLRGLQALHSLRPDEVTGG